MIPTFIIFDPLIFQMMAVTADPLLRDRVPQLRAQGRGEPMRAQRRGPQSPTDYRLWKRKGLSDSFL